MARRGTLATILIALTCFAAFARAADLPRRTTEPEWIARPSRRDLEAMYPVVADMLEVAGEAQINCRIDIFGKLDDCRITSESPRGFGFGYAALRTAPLIRMRPGTVDGEPVEERITIPIAFRKPGFARPTAPPRARPEGLALARAVTKALMPDALIEKHYGEAAGKIAADPSTPAGTREAVAAAYRAAVRAHLEDIREDVATRMAAELTPAELQMVQDFIATPAGALILPNPDLDAEREKIRRDLGEVQDLLAHDAFCKTRECDYHRLSFSPRGAKEPTMAVTDWVEQPSEREIKAARPALLDALDLTAAARLSCLIDQQGRLTDCRSIQEGPYRLGQGRAAIALASRFRVSPRLMSQGAAGERTAVDIIFPAAQLGAPYAVREPRSKEGLMLARTVAGRSTPEERKSGPERMVREMIEAVEADADPEALNAAKAALDEALTENEAWYDEEVASAFANAYSDEQLRQAAAFTKTPDAAAVRHLEAFLTDVALTSPIDFYRISRLDYQIISDTRAAFCAAYVCTARSSGDAVARRENGR